MYHYNELITLFISFFVTFYESYAYNMGEDGTLSEVVKGRPSSLNCFTNNVNNSNGINPSIPFEPL